MKKRYIFLSVLVLIVVGVYFFAPSLESIVQKVVHKYGSEITVGNPRDYSTKNLFELGEIYVKVDIKSLTSDTIVIENVEVSKPVINYEMLSLTRNNISDIQNNIKKNTAKTAQKETAETQKADGQRRRNQRCSGQGQFRFGQTSRHYHDKHRWQQKRRTDFRNHLQNHRKNSQHGFQYGCQQQNFRFERRSAKKS